MHNIESNADFCGEKTVKETEKQEFRAVAEYLEVCTSHTSVTVLSNLKKSSH